MTYNGVLRPFLTIKTDILFCPNSTKNPENTKGNNNIDIYKARRPISIYIDFKEYNRTKGTKKL